MPSQRSRNARAAELLTVCVRAAQGAAALIAAHASDAVTLDWRAKQRADFVTDVDTQAEAKIRDALAHEVPGATILGEELTPGAPLDAETAFIVDPLDGTTNFLHGYPAYAVSIAALLDGELAAGAVLNVAHTELFTATIGGGTFRNGVLVRVSAMSQPERALVGTGFPFKSLDQLDRYQRQFGRLLRESAGIRRAGSAALDLADVACGRFDAFWELRLAPWDIAAGMLLVREAGGVVTDLEGNDIAPAHTAVVASNGTLHDWMLRALQ
jgi:myo-inositol-1(or 4)-monophosphatase